ARLHPGCERGSDERAPVHKDSMSPAMSVVWERFPILAGESVEIPPNLTRTERQLTHDLLVSGMPRERRVQKSEIAALDAEHCNIRIRARIEIAQLGPFDLLRRIPCGHPHHLFNRRTKIQKLRHDVRHIF